MSQRKPYIVSSYCTFLMKKSKFYLDHIMISNIPTFFFLLLIPTTSSLSFNMSPISDGSDLDFAGTAYLSSTGIQVTTTDTEVVGWATYKEPLLLWDKSSKKLTDFSTNFSFIVDSNGTQKYGDGLAFFLAPTGSRLKTDTSGGGLGLGYVNTPPEVNSSSPEAFVAVEFDTFPFHSFDPPQYSDGKTPPHVGLDIYNIKSVATAAWTWYNSIVDGVESNVGITYNGTTKILRVEFEARSIRGTNRTRGELSYGVDLRDYLPENVTFGFSAATGLFVETHYVKSWSFSSTLRVDRRSSGGGSGGSGGGGGGGGGGNKKGLIVGLSVGATVLILALALTFAVYVLLKKRKKKEGLEDDDEFGKDTGPKRFSYNELLLATNNFDEQQKLGEGGFGAVYKGFLRSTKTPIAVKKVSKESKQGRKEYEAEVTIIGQLRHMNLVQLMGWCHQRSDLLLVYEFMPNKSLDYHLFRLNSTLTWETRHKVALGLASALLYLQEELRQYVVHRDIKASNIMLDANFNAMLGDFGLARLVDSNKDSLTTIPAGTMGYMAPEYQVTGRASKETDIYSFGVVLLEIACGRRPIDYRYPQNQIMLVEWVRSLYGGGCLLDGADPKLESSEDDVGKIERLMVVGLWCVHPDSRQRPSIRQVVQVLNFEAPLPLVMYDTNSRVVSESGSSSNGETTSLSNVTSSAGSASDLLLPKNG